jgi:hypothetical protein
MSSSLISCCGSGGELVQPNKRKALNVARLDANRIGGPPPANELVVTVAYHSHELKYKLLKFTGLFVVFHRPTLNLRARNSPP